MLDALFAAGQLVIAGRVGGFQRLYDLPERVLPADLLAAAPVPEADAIGELTVRAVRARGALTESAIAEHWRPIWWRGGSAGARATVGALVAEGRLERLAVGDGRAPVLVEPGVELDLPRPTVAVLLSPFGSLLWPD